MAQIELTPTTLIVNIEGADKFWALKSRLEVPLQHIAGVSVRPPEARKIWHGYRVGTNLPGVITAGRFFDQGGWSFWDVHDPDKAIAIRLHDERYSKVVIGVGDPDGTARRITAGLPPSPTGTG